MDYDQGYIYGSTSGIAQIKIHLYFLFSVAQQPNSGLGRLTVEISRSHTIRHIAPEGIL